MMSKVTIYDSEYITVEYWPDKKSIYHVVHKPMSEQLPIFKEALDAGTAALEKYQVNKWVSDDRKNDALTPEGNVALSTSHSAAAVIDSPGRMVLRY